MLRNQNKDSALNEDYETKADPKAGAITTIDEGDVGAYINKELRGLGEFVPTTFEELIKYATENDGEIIEFEGSPWEILKDKAKLVDVPFMIADVRYYEGKFGDAVAVMLMTEHPLPGTRSNRYVINDGSTGLYEQVVGMVKRAGRKVGISCPRGLRSSTYDYEAPDGTVTPATTYYVA